MQTEKRTSNKRFEIARPVELLAPSIGLVVSGYTRNISEAGLQVRIDEALTPGDWLKVSIVLEDNHPAVAANGQVIWCAPDIYGDGASVGLRFVEPFEDDAPAPQASPRDTRNKLRPSQKVTISTDEATFHAEVHKIEAHDEGPWEVTLFVKHDSAGTDTAPTPVQSPAAHSEARTSMPESGPADLASVQCELSPLTSKVRVAGTANTASCKRKHKATVRRQGKTKAGKFELAVKMAKNRGILFLHRARSWQKDRVNPLLAALAVRLPPAWRVTAQPCKRVAEHAARLLAAAWNKLPEKIRRFAALPARLALVRRLRALSAVCSNVTAATARWLSGQRQRLTPK